MNHRSHRRLLPQVQSLLGLGLLWLLGAGVSVGADGIRFAPLPMLDEKTLRAQYAPLLEQIERGAGEAIDWYYIPDYRDMLQALRDDRLDLASLGPLPYVQLTEVDPRFEPLVWFLEGDGSADYQCALVAFGAGDIRSPRDVQGSRIGLTQPESTCGYFAVSVMLDRAGRSLLGDGNRFEYAGGHDKAAQGVVDGTYDAAGVKEAIAREFAVLDLRIIDLAGPYPGFSLVANRRTLSAERRARIRDALLAAGGAARHLREPFNHGISAAHEADYEVLRADWRRVEELIGGAGVPSGK